MKKGEYENLALALGVAKKEAEKYANIEDNGTCNFDSPMVLLKGAKIKTLKEMFEEEYGVYAHYTGSYIIGHKIMCGQGWRRTKMAEAFAAKLRELGWDAYVNYVMD